MQDILLYEFDQIMIGKKRCFSSSHFSNDRTNAQRQALKVMKYAFEKYLHWTPEDVENRLTREVLCKLHLAPLLRYIRFPIEYDRDTDLYFLATLIYKNKAIDRRDRTIHTYERVLYGKQAKYPKDYFLGTQGILRSVYCLQYMLNHFVRESSINSLYCLFASNEGSNLLKKYKLSHAARDLYDTPVDYLHFSLPENMRSNFFLHYYKFKYLRMQEMDRAVRLRYEENMKLNVN